MADAKVLVAGASGYAGALAAVLVQRHPRLALSAITSRSDVGTRLDALYPHHRVALELEALDVERHGAEADVAIVAYPHGAAAPTVRALREQDCKVIDLSADFRLRARDVYERWYVPHTAPELLDDAVYGLPEVHREALRGADLVANPGCFPTAAILALRPFADAGLLGDDVVIDAKTGVSGAGRAATATTHFVAVDENVVAYKVGVHRHTPEIEQELGGVPVTFIPHLLPLDQGELVSCYFRVPPGTDLRGVLRDAYADEPFVELVDTPPGVRDVRDTNFCRVFAHLDERVGRAYVFAAIDNLWKGTASQAIQNLNLMLGFDETEGLL